MTKVATFAYRHVNSTAPSFFQLCSAYSKHNELFYPQARVLWKFRNLISNIKNKKQTTTKLKQSNKQQQQRQQQQQKQNKNKTNKQPNNNNTKSTSSNNKTNKQTNKQTNNNNEGPSILEYILSLAY